MSLNDFPLEHPENGEEKTTVIFTIDTSGSMSGDPISAVNSSIKKFVSSIEKNPVLSDRLEIGVVTFNSNVNTKVQPSLAKNIKVPSLSASGSTQMIAGCREAIELAESRKEWYKKTGQPYKRPWVIVITDGYPDNPSEVSNLESEVETLTKNKKIAFFPIGVLGADMNILNKIAGYTEGADNNFSKMQAAKLDGLKFDEFFEWLSVSMEMNASSQEGDVVQLPPTNGWANFTV